jgi:hypothetical protein
MGASATTLVPTGVSQSADAGAANATDAASAVTSTSPFTFAPLGIDDSQAPGIVLLPRRFGLPPTPRK